MFVPMIVSLRSKTICVHFLVDTVSPNTYQERIPGCANVIIHGTAITVQPSTNHFKNVDILGQDYLAKMGALMITNYHGTY